MKINFLNQNLSTPKKLMQSKNNVSFSRLDALDKALKLAKDDVIILSPSTEHIVLGKLEGPLSRFTQKILEKVKGNIVLVGKSTHDVNDISDLRIAGASEAIFIPIGAKSYEIFDLNSVPIQSKKVAILRASDIY